MLRHPGRKHTPGGHVGLDRKGSVELKPLEPPPRGSHQVQERWSRQSSDDQEPACAPAVRVDLRGPCLWRPPALSQPPALRQELLETLRSAEEELEGQLRYLLEEFRNSNRQSLKQVGLRRLRNRERTYAHHCRNVLGALALVRGCRLDTQKLVQSGAAKHDLEHIAAASSVSKCLMECRRLSLDSLPEASSETEPLPQSGRLRRENSAPAGIRRTRSKERGIESDAVSSSSISSVKHHHFWDDFSFSVLTGGLTSGFSTMVHAAEEVFEVVSAPAAQPEQAPTESSPSRISSFASSEPLGSSASRSRRHLPRSEDGAISCPEEPELHEQLVLESFERERSPERSPSRDCVTHFSDDDSRSSSPRPRFPKRSSPASLLGAAESPALIHRQLSPKRARAMSSYTYEVHMRKNIAGGAAMGGSAHREQLAKRWQELCERPRVSLAEAALSVSPAYDLNVPTGVEGTVVPLPIAVDDPGAIIAHALLSEGLWQKLTPRLQSHCLQDASKDIPTTLSSTEGCRSPRQDDAEGSPLAMSAAPEFLEVDYPACPSPPPSPPAAAPVRSPQMADWDVILVQDQRAPNCLGSLRGQDARPRVVRDSVFADAARADSPIQLEVAAGSSSPLAVWSVTVFQPVRFHLLRHLEFGDDAAFCALLRQCSPMLAKGGKSKAGFWCSAGGELVIKEVKAAEGRHLSENFAGPLAARLAAAAGAGGSPSLLCEVFALCDIRMMSCRRPSAGEGRRLPSRSFRTFIVMRNLRYGMKDPKSWQYFDLKGVGGDRKVESSTDFSVPSDCRRVRLPAEQEDPRAASQKVYWDSEFLQCLGGKKIPLRPGDHQALDLALCEDTRMLQDMGVVDYSLLLALRRPEGHKHGRVRLCLIDYLQPYTLEKQLESGFKKVVLGRSNPTIVGPVDYRQRFLAFLRQAFETEHARSASKGSPG